jgi:hypothetical protein
MSFSGFLACYRYAARKRTLYYTGSSIGQTVSRRDLAKKSCGFWMSGRPMPERVIMHLLPTRVLTATVCLSYLFQLHWEFDAIHRSSVYWRNIAPDFYFRSFSCLFCVWVRKPWQGFNGLKSYRPTPYLIIVVVKFHWIYDFVNSSHSSYMDLHIKLRANKVFFLRGHARYEYWSD